MNESISISKNVEKKLKRSGYKKRYVVTDYILDNRVYDIVITSPYIDKPIAVFEIKSLDNSDTIKREKSMYSSFVKRFGEIQYIVIIAAGTPKEKIYRLEMNNNDIESREIDKIPKYKELENSFKRKYPIHTIRRDIIRKKGYLKIICWIIVPLVALLILVLDGLDIFTLNTNRLILIGAVWGIIIFPCVERISVKDLDIIFEQNKLEKK